MSLTLVTNILRLQVIRKLHHIFVRNNQNIGQICIYSVDDQCLTYTGLQKSTSYFGQSWSETSRILVRLTSLTLPVSILHLGSTSYAFNFLTAILPLLLTFCTRQILVGDTLTQIQTSIPHQMPTGYMVNNISLTFLAHHIKLGLHSQVDLCCGAKNGLIGSILFCLSPSPLPRLSDCISHAAF